MVKTFENKIQWIVIGIFVFLLQMDSICLLAGKPIREIKFSPTGQRPMT